MDFGDLTHDSGGGNVEGKLARLHVLSSIIEVYDSVIDFMTNDIHANFGHMKVWLGVLSQLISAVGGNISYTKDKLGVPFIQLQVKMLIQKQPLTMQLGTLLFATALLTRVSQNHSQLHLTPAKWKRLAQAKKI